jgi:hypothetical protein
VEGATERVGGKPGEGVTGGNTEWRSGEEGEEGDVAEWKRGRSCRKAPVSAKT